MGPVREEELRWYFLESAGDLGLHGASYGFDTASDGPVYREFAPKSSELAAATKQRAIRATLATLSPEYQRTLHAVYGLASLLTSQQRRALSVFGQYGALAIVVAGGDIRAIERVATLAGSSRSKNSTLGELAGIVADCERRHTEAGAAYVVARREQGEIKRDYKAERMARFAATFRG